MSNKLKISSEKISGGFVKKLTSLFLIVGIASLIATLFFLKKDPHHYYPSYLVSFYFFLTITLGNLFFVLFQHISRAGWSASVRRVAELIMSNITLMAILFIPILFGIHELYHWSHHEAVAADHLLHGKQPYLNVPFFIGRAFVFFGVWMLIVKKYLRGSLEQDQTGDSSITLKLQKAATYSIIIFALTITFSGIDWIMSLTPHWYSTIFGVYMFAGALVGGVATLTLILMTLRKLGYLKDVVNVEHFHDLGKLLYGFNIFWSYIAFSQYFLIWYGNIPEETHWYSDHFFGTWNTVSIVLAVGHFAIPFIFFMSRHAKRYLPYHCGMAIWLLAMHILDLYWVVMPTFSKSGIHLTIVDLTSFLAIAGIFLYTLFKKMSTVSIVAVNDPRMDEALKFHNY